MKLIVVLFMILCAYSTKVKSVCDKESACSVCQKTVYNLKFNYKPSCTVSHCNNVCYKVIRTWSQPGSVFGAFLNDSVGKCDVCFRAGYCSMSQCTAQKRREQQVIEKAVDGANVQKHSVYE